jgi:hypothetical protein
MSLRLGIILVLLLTAGVTASATPCAQIKSQPDIWVNAEVDLFVQAAHRAFEKDETLPYQRVLGGISQTMQGCKLTEDPTFLSRYRVFVEYIDALAIGQRPDHELGFLVPDKQYFEETKQYVQIPPFLLTQNFLRLVSRDETLPKAKAFLRELNSTRAPDEQLLFFSYRSQHLGTPDNDNSFKRLLIVIPGNAEQGVLEKWVQFGITDRGARVHIRNLSIVSSIANDDGTSSVYFKDFFRTYRRDGSINVNGRWDLGQGDDNCARCHKSGILPIFPEPGSVTLSEQPALAAVNQRFLTYSSPRFENYLDETRFGPGIGSRMDSHTEHAGATVERAMVCGSCHQPARFGALNWPMDSVLISSYVKGGQMPLSFQLKSAERNELYKKLIQEYFAVDKAKPGILKSWLLGR